MDQFYLKKAVIQASNNHLWTTAGILMAHNAGSAIELQPINNGPLYCAPVVISHIVFFKDYLMWNYCVSIYVLCWGCELLSPSPITTHNWVNALTCPYTWALSSEEHPNCKLASSELLLPILSNWTCLLRSSRNCNCLECDCMFLTSFMLLEAPYTWVVSL